DPRIAHRQLARKRVVVQPPTARLDAPTQRPEQGLAPRACLDKRFGGRVIRIEPLPDAFATNSAFIPYAAPYPPVRKDDSAGAVHCQNSLADGIQDGLKLARAFEGRAACIRERSLNPDELAVPRKRLNALLVEQTFRKQPDHDRERVESSVRVRD